MTMTEIVFKIQESNPDRKAFRFKTVTQPKLTKKNRATGAPTDFSVEIVSEFTAKLGVNYEAEVNAVREAEGLPADFEAKKPSGKHYVNGTNWLMESDTQPGRFYVALSFFENESRKYLIEGHEATPEQIEDLRANYLPRPSAHAPAVKWRTYGIDSIVSVEAA